MCQSDKKAYLIKKSIRGTITASDLKNIHETKKALRRNGINTVCESAKCPNLSECFAKSNATFIILGSACTRDCAFCAVTKKAPQAVDEAEPKNVARTVKELNLKHVVITSVTRDDLPDRGIAQFIAVVREVKNYAPDTSIELLTPDFDGVSDEKLSALLKEKFQIFGHNLEMVERLYSTLRKNSDYERSINLLKKAKENSNDIKVKSAIMLGLGETEDEVRTLLSDVKDTGCDIIVIGQYLQPTLKHAPVEKYYSQDEFKYYEEFAYSLGFENVHSFPKARSSYAG